MEKIKHWFLKMNTQKQVIYTTKAKVSILAEWSKDEGTKETRLVLILVYPDGEVSPIMEYQKSRLVNEKAFMNLVNMDGVELDEVEKIYKAFLEKKEMLTKYSGGEGKGSLTAAYIALCDYVGNYEEPQKVFVRDNYGFILSSYLSEVLAKLEIGYTRLELQKNFKALGLLQINEGTMHPYSYKVRDKWFFSFRLLDADRREEA